MTFESGSTFQEVSTKLKRWFLNGVLVSIPLVVTILLVMFILDFLLGILSPITVTVADLWTNEPPFWVLEVTTLVSLVGFLLLVGVLADYTPRRRISEWLDRSMGSIPVISSMYTTVRRTSQRIAAENASRFQNVKLVEFPHQQAYMLGFVTQAPTASEGSLPAGEMITLMIPLAPNPSTNGLILYVPADRVHDVDMEVEQAIQAITTLGVMSDRFGDDTAVHQ